MRTLACGLAICSVLCWAKTGGTATAVGTPLSRQELVRGKWEAIVAGREVPTIVRMEKFVVGKPFLGISVAGSTEVYILDSVAVSSGKVTIGGHVPVDPGAKVKLVGEGRSRGDYGWIDVELTLPGIALGGGSIQFRWWKGGYARALAEASAALETQLAVGGGTPRAQPK